MYIFKIILAFGLLAGFSVNASDALKEQKDFKKSMQHAQILVVPAGSTKMPKAHTLVQALDEAEMIAQSRAQFNKIIARLMSSESKLSDGQKLSLWVQVVLGNTVSYNTKSLQAYLDNVNKFIDSVLYDQSIYEDIVKKITNIRKSIGQSDFKDKMNEGYILAVRYFKPIESDMRDNKDLIKGRGAHHLTFRQKNDLEERKQLSEYYHLKNICDLLNPYATKVAVRSVDFLEWNVNSHCLFYAKTRLVSSIRNQVKIHNKLHETLNPSTSSASTNEISSLPSHVELAKAERARFKQISMDQQGNVLVKGKASSDTPIINNSLQDIFSDVGQLIAVEESIKDLQAYINSNKKPNKPKKKKKAKPSVSSEFHTPSQTLNESKDRKKEVEDKQVTVVKDSGTPSSSASTSSMSSASTTSLTTDTLTQTSSSSLSSNTSLQTLDQSKDRKKEAEDKQLTVVKDSQVIFSATSSASASSSAPLVVEKPKKTKSEKKAEAAQAQYEKLVKKYGEIKDSSKFDDFQSFVVNQLGGEVVFNGSSHSVTTIPQWGTKKFVRCFPKRPHKGDDKHYPLWREFFRDGIERALNLTK